jgi:hypothetical protein
VTRIVGPDGGHRPWSQCWMEAVLPIGLVSSYLTLYPGQVRRQHTRPEGRAEWTSAQNGRWRRFLLCRRLRSVSLKGYRILGRIPDMQFIGITILSPPCFWNIIITSKGSAMELGLVAGTDSNVNERLHAERMGAVPGFGACRCVTTPQSYSAFHTFPSAHRQPHAVTLCACPRGDIG